MALTNPSSGECATDSHALRRAAYRVDFRLVYVAIGVAGFKMSWTAPDDDLRGDSNLFLVREFSTAVTSSTATHEIQWAD